MTLSVHSVLELFREEIGSLGGRVSDQVADGRRLFARAVLSAEALVAPADRVNAGVALRFSGEQVEVRPYVFREICRNGAIDAQSALGREIDLRGVGDPVSRMVEIRHAIRAAASPEAFAELAGAMRASRTRMLDFDLLLAVVGQFAGREPRFILDYMQLVARDGARTMFAAGNVLTALARDTRDPDLRWRREAAGAAIFAKLSAPVRARVRSDALLQPQ